LLPGFKPFGSSVCVANAGFPHATHDIDGYMLWEDFNDWMGKNADKYKIEQTSGDTYAVNLFPSLKNKEGIIDVNVLRSNNAGYIIGPRALEMAR